ncbi:uncharacterized protein LOC122289701 isoform X2 [Carya illinoinensis]|uniref:Uncharacterized protein n=1 Tax=Carya illinoinensis TaxID=32201 RepID=A0A922K690_CARIL|nr:uncharacterized protein LOC122289701 isoform X2 [Carya illinoinensis]KAG6734558.1 hypothetical protein I3842_01G278100 [Carya illinoinensis]
MASENYFQELQFSVPDARQKVDGFSVFEAGSPQTIDNWANLGGKMDSECLQTKPKYNIRKSLAWDSAFFTSPGVLDPEELFQTLKFGNTGNSLDLLGNEEQKVVPFESLEAERTDGICKSNLRKSLAWDSAFFTSAGVLEPEELSIINEGFRNFESHPLPGIEEELWRSAESNSTVDSDGSPLASLEMDLFEDIRASAHKLTQASNATPPSSNFHRGRHMKNVHSSKKDDHSSQVRMKHTPTSRWNSFARRGLGRVAYESSVSAQSQHGAGTGVHNPKCAAEIGEFNPNQAAKNGEPHLSSSLKPPKISGRTGQTLKALPKRASLGPNHVNLETPTLKATSGACLTVSKKPYLGVSSSGIRSSLQSSLLSSPTATTEFAVSSSPHGRFYCSATDIKSPLSYLRGAGTERTNFVSTNCTSPVSSIDGCSLESSSTSTNQGSNKSTAQSDTTMETHQHDEYHVGFECREQSSPFQVSKKILAESSAGPSDVLRNSKPSCLKRPSPKIGFFDAENSTTLILHRGPQFHSGVPSTSSKSGTGNNPDGAGNRAEYGKLQPTRKLKGARDTKTGSQKIRAHKVFNRPSHPLQFGEAKKVLPQASISMKDSFATTSRALNNLPSRMGSKHCLKAKSLSKMGAECEDQGFLKAKPRSTRKREDSSVRSPEIKLHAVVEDEKENFYGVKKQVDSLGRRIGAFDLNSEMVIEL